MLHETPLMDDLLRPKIVFKDIAKTPAFWPEPAGDVVPRYDVYYMVPEEGVEMEALLEYLNGALDAGALPAGGERISQAAEPGLAEASCSEASAV